MYIHVRYGACAHLDVFRLILVLSHINMSVITHGLIIVIHGLNIKRDFIGVNMKTYGPIVEF